MQFGDLHLKQCRYGWMLYPLGPLYVGKCLDFYGQYSEGEVSLLRALLSQGDTAIDVGANIGALTVPISQIVGLEGRVYAVEADASTFNVLCANLALNGIRNARPIYGWVTAGDAQALSPLAGNASPVPAIALDALDLPACALIKVDVDGGELDVFRSGEMQIERFRPLLYFENELREKSADLLSFVIDTLGYRVYFHPTPLFDPDNFAGNPVNHWAPTQFVSMMMLAVPKERKAGVQLKQLSGTDDWWDFSAPVTSYYTAG